jgi:leader peptidase (prepilin peptidase) / N-methyltransferase
VTEDDGAQAPSAALDDQRQPRRNDLRPDLRVLVVGTAAIAALSLLTLQAPAAWISIVLGALMIAGAEIDARTFMLPDTVTGGTLLAGLLAAPILDPGTATTALGIAALRAIGTAAVLLTMRWGYARLRHRQGLGLGDVKLAAGIGACSALILVAVAHQRDKTVHAATRLPFGTFLCPALWVLFYLCSWGG